jgi:hypothetical protein
VEAASATAMKKETLVVVCSAADTQRFSNKVLHFGIWGMLYGTILKSYIS